MAEWWRYDELESGAPYDWHPAGRGDSEFDAIDFHLDLGCGRLKKGRLGIDRHPDPGVDLAMDLETLEVTHADAIPEARIADLFEPRIAGWMTRAVTEGEVAPSPKLPFPDASIESIISHHALEHIGGGFLRVMDECYRVLVPGGLFRVIVPVFPSRNAVEDPDHKRYFMAGTFEAFCGRQDTPHWSESFSTPYTACRFELIDKWVSPALPLEEMWGDTDAREIRVTLKK